MSSDGQTEWTHYYTCFRKIDEGKNLTFPAIQYNCPLLSHLLMYFSSLYLKQYRPKSD